MATLSICVTCRDGNENEYGGSRGGARFAESFLGHARRGEVSQDFEIRAVRCLSQCKRPCAIALSGFGRFNYIFGDLEPGNRSQINALYELVGLYKSAPEGFLRRRERPEPLRGNIVGRIPPLETMSDLIVPLPKRPSETLS